MADTVGEDDSPRMKRSKAKHVPILLDLWSSSDDEETSDVFSLASSAARFSEAKSSDNQIRIEPSQDTGVMVHQQPNRGRDKIAPSTTQHVWPRISSSKVHSRPKALTLKKRKLPETIDSLFTSSPPAGRKSSPVFPCSRKTVSLTYPHRTRLKTPTESSEDSTEEDSDVNSGGTTMKHNSCMYLRGNTGRQSSLKQSNDKFGRLPSSSSSESSSSDAESGATGVKNGNSCSRATIGWQPRREQTSSKYNSKLMFGSDSSTSSSSSSDSESLLSPTKSKRTQVQRSSGATVPGQTAKSSSLLQRVSSRLQPSQDLRKPGRCKRGLSKKGNQVPRFKRARVSQTFGIASSESSSSSSSDTESEASLNSYLLDLKTRKRTAETIQRSRGGNKALGNGQQNPSPEKVTRRKMITLFGRTSSEEGRDTAEEDAKELGDEQEDNITETQTNKASVSSTNPQTSMFNLTGLSRGDNRHAGGISSEATTRKKINSLSERDDSVILVDITQSTERGALARQSRPQAKTNPSTKQGFGESQNTEGTSPIFSRHAHTRKELPVRRSDVSVLVGNMARDDTFKITRDSSPKAPKISHPGHVPNDTLITSSADGMRHSPSSKASTFKQNVAHSGSQSPVIGSQSPVIGSQSPVIGSQSPVFGSQSPVFRSHSPTFGISNWLTESSRYSSNADKLHVRTCSRESSGVKSSNSQGQVSSTDSQDKFRFPSMCFEEKHLHWLEDTRGSSLHDGNEATATSDPTGSSITIFRRDFFVKSSRTDQSSQSSNARNTTVSLIADGEDRSQRSEQMHCVRGDQKSPPLVRSPSRVRRNRAAYENKGKTSQSLDSRNTAYLSLNEDHRPEEMRGGTEVMLSSSSSGLNRRRGDRHEVIKNKRSRHDAKSKTSQISKHHSRGDTCRSHSLTVSDGQVHHLQNVEVGSRQAGQHINYDWSESIIAGSLSFTEPHSDVQVLEDQSAHQHSVKLPLKARHKSKHGATISGNQDTRQKRSNNNAASQVSSRSTGDPSPDVQVVGSRESRRSVGEPSVRRKSRGAEVSESTDSTDIDVVELVRQLDEDERMAKQLQEHFDAELARLTQEHSRIMSSHNEILAQPLIMPELPTLPGPPLPRPPPLFPPRTQMANPVMPGIAGHQEMMWRDDLVDMNPINAAMMAEMGRFLDNNTEGQAGYGYRGRQRRGRARGRGRSRTRGHHHNPVQSDGNDYEQLWNLVERVGEAVSKGLPESSINLLPTFLYTTAGQDATENECSICMGDYEAGENMRRLPCFHFYHAACIDKWLKDNRICPVCREEVNFEAANFT